MNNPFNDKINKAVAEAARKVMEQTKKAEQIDEAKLSFVDDHDKTLYHKTHEQALKHVRNLHKKHGAEAVEDHYHENNENYQSADGMRGVREGNPNAIRHRAHMDAAEKVLGRKPRTRNVNWAAIDKAAKKQGMKHVATAVGGKVMEQTINEAQEEHVEVKNYPHLHDFVHGSGSANSGESREDSGKIKVKKSHAEKAEEALKKAKQKGMDLHGAGASADEGEDYHEGHKIPSHALRILDKYIYEEFQQIDERGMVGRVNRMQKDAAAFQAGGGHNPGAAPLSQSAVADRVAAGRKIQKADTGPKQTGDRKADARARIADLKNSRGYGSHLPEEAEQDSGEFVLRKGVRGQGSNFSDLQGTHHGVNVKPVYTSRKEAEKAAKLINIGRGYDPERDKDRALTRGVLYQVFPRIRKEEAEQMNEGGNYGKKYDAAKHIASMTNAEIEKRIAGWEEFKQKNPNMPHRVTHDQLAMLRAERASRIGKKKTNEEVEQMEEGLFDRVAGAFRDAGAKKFKKLLDGGTPASQIATHISTMPAKKRQDIKSAISHHLKSNDHAGLKKLHDMIGEEAEHMDESRRWNPDGSPKNVGLKAAKKFGKEQDQKTALHHFAKGAAKDDLSKFKKEETSHIAERLIGKQHHKIDANKNGKIDAHDFKLLRKKSKMMKESYLVEDTTPALSAAMKAILADAFHMYFKAHTFHWNVEGADFPQYHKFFGDVYEQLFDTIDPIAEEIRALGDYAPRSLTELKGSTSIEDSSVQTPAEMFASLLGDNSKIIAGLMNGYKVAEASGEVGLANFLQDKIDAHKKLGWMIKSVSKGA